MAAGATVGILAGPGMLLVGMVLRRLTNDPAWLQSRQLDFIAPPADGQGHPRMAIAGMLLLTVLLGPCAEESMFRGVVFPGIRNALGLWIAVPSSAVIFGLFHLDHGLPAVLFSTVIGVACALLVSGSGSLWPAIVAHILVNSKLIPFYFRSFRERAGSAAAE